jgi:hypothetical protein
LIGVRFSEEIIQYSRTFAPQVQTSWNQAHAPLLVESFPKTSREIQWFNLKPLDRKFHVEMWRG